VSYYDPAGRDPALSRRPGNRRSDGWISALLARLPVGRFATRWDETLFINPTTFVYQQAGHRLVFHSNLAGRMRANAERSMEPAEGATFEATEFGRLLPSNDPLELSMQYRSVIAFGRLAVLEGEEARTALEALCVRHFPALRPGVDTRPISDDDLARTSVYALNIERWSGKENWEELATQTEEWPPLTAEQLKGI
jgi:uncharacterized protein